MRIRVILACLLLSLWGAGQQPGFLKPILGGSYVASQYGQWTLPADIDTDAGRVGIIRFVRNNFVLPDSVDYSPLAPGALLTVSDGPNSEVVALVSVVCGLGLPYPCTGTASFASGHHGRVTLSSATFGLQEAVNAAQASGGGEVLITPDWKGTTAQIAGISGGTDVLIRDLRGGQDDWYGWNGTSYIPVLTVSSSGISLGVAVSAKSMGHVLYADQFPGADIGAKINTAIAALPANGGTIVVPAGDYSLTTPIVISRPGVILTGQGYGTTLHYSGSGDAIFLGVPGSSSDSNVNLGAVLRDFILQGTAASLSGVHCYNANNIIIRNVQVSGFAQDGMRMEFCQYGSVNDSSFSANHEDGLNALQAVIPGFTRGANEQSNTWVFTNDKFIANSQWGVRLQASREFVFIKPTIQANGAGGRLSTGDVAGATGGTPAGTPSGTYSEDNIEINGHYELNSGTDYYCEHCSRETLLAPTMDSSAPHFVLNNDPLISDIDLQQPEFLDASHAQITVPAKVSNCDIDLGNAVNSEVSIDSPSTLAHAGNAFSSALVGAAGKPFVVGPTDVNTDLILQGAVPTILATGSAHKINLQIGSQAPWSLVGSTTANRTVTLPDNSGPVAETNLIQSWAATQTFSSGIAAATIGTTSNCSSVSVPAACGSAAAGAVAILGGNSSLVVDSTAITANSQIVLTFDASLGNRLGVICNTAFTQPYVSARAAGNSFTVTLTTAPSVDPVCLSYLIVN